MSSKFLICLLITLYLPGVRWNWKQFSEISFAKLYSPVVILLCRKAAWYATVGFVCTANYSWLECAGPQVPVLHVHGEASTALLPRVYTLGLQETVGSFRDSRSFCSIPDYISNSPTSVCIFYLYLWKERFCVFQVNKWDILVCFIYYRVKRRRLWWWVKRSFNKVYFKNKTLTIYITNCNI
jgi:hypothetical protein